MTNIQQSHAGNYVVNVANAGGNVTNRSAGLRVLARLDHSLAAGNLILTWTGPYTLQSAKNAPGPYFDLPAAASPYTNLMNGEPNRFFRLRSEPINGVVSNFVAANGQMTIHNSGLAGYDYVLQASTNLSEWISIETNAAPFGFLEPVPDNVPMRFYRTLFLP